MVDKGKKVIDVEFNKKQSIMKSIILIISVTAIIVTISLYITNNNFRNVIDIYVLRKNIQEENLKIIQINSDENPYVYAYDKYITVLIKNELKLYTRNAENYATINMNVNNPIMFSNGKYLAIAEEKGKKLYVTSGSNLLWQKDVDGEISGININKNGYVTVIVSNTTHKSLIITYNADGIELFRTFLSEKYALCAEVSGDNKYLAIGEINYSGSIIKSTVKIISIEDAQKDKENAVKKIYEAENGELLLGIKYNDRDDVICSFANYVQAVNLQGEEKILDIDKNTFFLDIHLRNNIAKIEKESTGLFSYLYQMRIINSQNKKESLYVMNDMPKAVKVYNDKILLNLGTELEIVNLNGWLVKKYSSRQEIKDVVLSSDVVGVIYKDKIEIINL